MNLTSLISPRLLLCIIFFQHLVGRHIFFFSLFFIVDYFLLIFVLPLWDEAYSIGLDNLFHVFLESVDKYFIEYLWICSWGKMVCNSLFIYHNTKNLCWIRLIISRSSSKGLQPIEYLKLEFPESVNLIAIAQLLRTNPES